VSVVVEVGKGMKGVTDPLALHLWGVLCAHEGRYYEAEGAFLSAIEVDPEMAGSYVELGLVYACRGEYRDMVEALGRAVAGGAGGVRAYLGERPLGDVPADATTSTEGDGEGVPSLATAMEHLAEGRDAEAAVILERSLEGKPSSPPLSVALLALAYLLRGEAVEADGAGVSRMAVAAEGQACDR
jgi:Flp pilus assembly protein TadD